MCVFLDGTMCRIAGWGTTKIAGNGVKTTPAFLQEVDIPILNWHSCYENYHKAAQYPEDNIQSNVICAGSKEKDSCFVSLIYFETIFLVILHTFLYNLVHNTDELEEFGS